MRLKRPVNVALQILALAGATLLPAAPISEKWRPFAAAAFAFPAAAAGVIAHGRNPDGTPASVPYIPPRSEIRN